MEDPALSQDQDKRIRWIGGQKIVLDKGGFLTNPSLWTEEVAGILAGESGIETLDDKQWQIIHFIRTFYIEQGKAPLNHKLKVGLGMKLSEIESLFPDGIIRGAHRLAGLPNRKGCSGG